MSSIRRETVSLGAVQFSMLTAGPLTGEPVLLLHGIPAGAELWREGLTRLSAAGYRVFAPDLPGYGETRLSPGSDRSLAGAAALIARWLVETNVPPVWVVGHDLGGGVAQMLVVRAPEQVARLTLTNSPVEDSWPPTPVRFFRWLARLGCYPFLARLGIVDHDPYFARQLRRGFAYPERLNDPKLRWRVFYDTKVSDPRGRREFAAHLAVLDNRQTIAVAQGLAQVTMPTLLLWGMQDVYQSWDRAGQRLQQLLPHAQVHQLPQAGHFLMLDRPDAFYSALLAWTRSAGTEPTRSKQTGQIDVPIL